MACLRPIAAHTIALAILLTTLTFGFCTSGKSCGMPCPPSGPIGLLSNEEGRPLCLEAYSIMTSINNRLMR
jgi:hypothetical protein